MNSLLLSLNSLASETELRVCAQNSYCSLLYIIETAFCALQIVPGDSKASGFVLESCFCEVPLRSL